LLALAGEAATEILAADTLGRNEAKQIRTARPHPDSAERLRSLRKRRFASGLPTGLLFSKQSTRLTCLEVVAKLPRNATLA
jgi:hypothetical protein